MISKPDLREYLRIKAELVSDRFPGLTYKVRSLRKNLDLEDEYGSPTLELAKGLMESGPLELTIKNETPGWKTERYTHDDVFHWLLAIEKYDSELSGLAKSKVADMYADLALIDDEIENAILREKDRHYFFSERASSANFDAWLPLAFWSVEECVALSLGKDPGIVNSQTLNSRVAAESPFYGEYLKNLSVLMREVKVGSFPTEIPPKKFIQWAIKNDIFHVSDEFRNWYASTTSKFPALKDLEPAEKVDSRSRTSYHKFILAMAIAQYNYTSPGTNKAAVHLQISTAMKSLGINMHEDTVEKHLVAALKTAIAKGGAWIADGSNKSKGKFKDPW